MDRLGSTLLLSWCMACVCAAIDVGSGNWSVETELAPKAAMGSLDVLSSQVDMCRGLDCGFSGHCMTFQPDRSRRLFYPLCHDPAFFINVHCGEGACMGGSCIKDRCFCPPGTHGMNCADTSTPCTLNPCPGLSVCITFSGGRHGCVLPGRPVSSLQYSRLLDGGRFAPLSPPVPRNICFNIDCGQGFVCDVFRPLSGVSSPFCYRPSPSSAFIGCPPGICGVGTCMNNRCFCPEGVHGDRCQTSSTSCTPSACPQSATCVTVSGGGHFCHFLPTPVPTTTTIPSVSDVCASNQCGGSPGCRCVPSCMHELGYYCLSSRGFIGRHCDIGPPRVYCNDNSIRVEIPSAYLEEYASGSITSFLYMSNDLDGSASTQTPCRAVSVNGMHVITVPAFSTLCGNTLVSGLGRDVVYSNNIWINDKPSSLYDLPRAVLNFSCSYQKEYSIVTSLKPVVDIPRPQVSGEMRARTSIGLCKVSTCSDSCPSHLVVSHGAIYTVAETIHLSVNVDPLNSFGQVSLVAEVMDAHLSCSSTSSTTDHVLLKEGCHTDRDLNSRLGRRNDRSMCMSFRVPRLNGCTEFFIHVRMFLCDKANIEPLTCPDGSTYNVCRNTVQKRSVGHEDSMDRSPISRVLGPITISSAHDGRDRITFNSDSGEPLVVVSTVSNNTDLHLLSPVSSTVSAGHYYTPFLIFAIALSSLALLLLVSVLLCRRYSFPPSTNT